MKRALPAAMILASLIPALAQEKPRPMPMEGLVERPSDPPASGDPRANPEARSLAPSFGFGSYNSVQVNVDALGMNIVDDAANEPSIAVSPTDPDRMVIGWRQFNNVASDHREAGYAYTSDGGATWTFPGNIEPGVFRSDPVLGSDSSGNFYYQSLTATPDFEDFFVDVFRSTDGGATWPVKIPSFGGDKNWMVIDKSGTSSDGHIYGIWQRFFSCCNPNVLTRSTDGGATFEFPVAVDLSPTFGTMAVGPNGELYMGGIDGTIGQDLDTFVVSRSLDASNPGVSPTSSGTVVDLGGSMGAGGTPNPGGLLGQASVAVDRSNGPGRGNVYLVASVARFPVDPMDVAIARSEDGGATWSPPVRINDDFSVNNWQWMAAVDVAPDGRIDVIWYDTRGGGAGALSQLYYSYSEDAGDHWAKNVAVTPQFNSLLGWPGGQQKMGDYIGIVSDAGGANAAYAATFNGEQDVYYVRLFPDCNQNGILDSVDLSSGTSPDSDGDGLPDECNVIVSFGAGSVPDGGPTPGTPLTVSHAPLGEIELSWGASCSPGDDYAIYEGGIPTFTSVAVRFCSTGGNTTQRFSPIESHTFYLVVPVNQGGPFEGSYGLQSPGIERPAAELCGQQVLLACEP